MVDISGWCNDLLLVCNRSNEHEEKAFLKLLDQIPEGYDDEVIKTLMKTFSNKPDYGTQEKVIEIFSRCDPRKVCYYLMLELPRLRKEADEWVETLLGYEIDNHVDYLIEFLSAISPNIRTTLICIISNRDFQNFYPNTKKILNAYKL